MYRGRKYTIINQVQLQKGKKTQCIDSLSVQAFVVLRGQTEGSLKENEVPCSSIERRGKRNKKEAKNGCRATQSKLSKRKREKVGEKGSRLVCFLPFALTLKDMSVLMSQKALNNTANQYISPLMGFFELYLLPLMRTYTPEHQNTHIHINNAPYGHRLVER